MRLIPLNDQERKLTGFSHKVYINYADLVTLGGANLTLSKTIFPFTGTFPAGTCVRRCGVRVPTYFQGGATSSLIIRVGDGNADNGVLADTQIHNSSGSKVTFWEAANLVIYNVADTAEILFTAVGANLNALTAGEVEIYLATVDYNDLVRPKGS